VVRALRVEQYLFDWPRIRPLTLGIVPLSHANLIVCETVLTEDTTHLVSALRITDSFAVIGPILRFWVVTHLHSHPFDVAPHTLQVQMVRSDNSNTVAWTNPANFYYGYRQGMFGPGGYLLRTEFNLNVSRLMPLGLFYIQALLDSQLVAQVPLTLHPQ